MVNFLRWAIPIYKFYILPYHQQPKQQRHCSRNNVLEAYWVFHYSQSQNHVR